MTTVIKLYNPNERPFGDLSNNSRHQIWVDGKVWKTVTNYIYASMLSTPLYRTILQNSPIKGRKKNTNIDDKVNQLIANAEGIQRRKLTQSEKAEIYRNAMSEVQTAGMNIDQVFNMYLGKEYFTTVRTAVEKAYNTKFSENEDLVHILLSTGYAPIHYVSNNTMLGGGPDGKGQNIIGITLMQIRHNLRVQAHERVKEQQDKLEENHIFTAYLAYKILLNELNRGKDIKQYLGKNAAEIVQLFQGGNEIGYVFNAVNTEINLIPEIVAMYRRGQFPDIATELKNPGTLGVVLRKKWIGKIAKNSEEARKNAIFSTYVKYEAKKVNQNLSEDQLETAYRQLITQAPSTDQYLALRDRVIKLYTSGSLSENCSAKIDHELNKINVPSASDIEEAEQSIISNELESEIEEKDHSSSSSLGENDPLKALLQTDDQSKKHNIIKRLQHYTGHAYKKYRKHDIEKLQDMLNKYETGKKKRKGGEYRLLATFQQRRINKETLEKISRDLENFKREGFTEVFTRNMEPISIRQIGEELLAHAQKMDGEVRPIRVVKKEWIPGGGKFEVVEEKTIQKTPVFKTKDGVIVFDDEGFPQQTGDFEEKEIIQRRRKWIPDPAMEPEKKVHFPETFEELENVRYIKPYGEPIRIFADPAKNDPQFVSFVPTANAPFTIDDIIYPNVSMYIVTSLLSTTGTTMSMKTGFRTISKGMSIQQAVKLLQKGSPPRFVDIDTANQIYTNENSKTFHHLLEVYAKIGIWEKFKDHELKDLLLITQNAKLVWADPTDTFLGIGTKEHPGQNIVGKLLMEKRAEIAESLDKEETIAIKPHMIEKFIERDRFMMNWINMRLRDMCGAVYQVKQYLWNVQKLDEEIDAKFATTVLDTIFQPCSYINEYIDKIDLPVPKYFVQQVANCGGMQFNIDIKLEKRIVDLKKSIEQEENSTSAVGPNLSKLREKHAEELRILLEDNEKPALRDEEIENEMNQFDKMLKKQRKKLRKSKSSNLANDLIQLKEIQKKLREEKWEELNAPKISESEANERLLNLQRRHAGMESGQMPLFQNVKSVKEERLRQLTSQLTQRRFEKRKMVTGYEIRLRDLAKVYWDRLVVMIYFLMQHIKSQEQGIKPIDLKLALAKIETLNSSEKICKRILVDERDNCIASALINLLAGIEKFKLSYAEDIPLGISDINLASSIIVNRNITKEDVEIVDEPGQQFLEEDGDFEMPDEADEDNMDPYADFEEVERKSYSDEEANFGFRKRTNRPNNDDLEIIKGELRNLDFRNSIVDELATYFVGAMNSIKNSSISKKVKTNRINFFATLR